jgi:hypothetical protein
MQRATVKKTPGYLTAAALTVVLLATAASAQYGYFGQNKVRDRELDWQILSTEHFDIYFYPDTADVVGGVAEMAEAAWKKLTGELGRSPVHRIPFILYASGRDFRQTNIYLGFLPDGVGGFSEAGRNRVVIPFEGSQPRMWDTTVHELTHVFSFYYFYRDMTGELLNAQVGTPDFWFMEGIAEHEARDWDTDGRMVLRDAILGEHLVPLDQLRYGDYIPGWALYLTYKEGQSALDFFVEHYGAEKLPELMEAIAAEPDRDVSKALEKTVGVDLRDFGEEWTLDLKRRYWVELVEGRRPEDIAHRVTKIDERYTSYVGPRFSPSGELLAVISNLDYDANVYLVDADKGEVFQRLTDAGITTTSPPAAPPWTSRPPATPWPSWPKRRAGSTSSSWTPSPDTPTGSSPTWSSTTSPAWPSPRTRNLCTSRRKTAARWTCTTCASSTGISSSSPTPPTSSCTPPPRPTERPSPSAWKRSRARTWPR